MEWLNTHASRLSESAQLLYVMIAVFGGLARYLNSYTKGTPFKLSIFFASAFVAGFSGWMFSQIGISMGMPVSMIYMMAGTGGFFGEQTMKYILEWLQNKGKIQM